VNIASLPNLPYGIGITIALAELTWGFIKYYTAPTLSQRRETIEEFYSIVIGLFLSSLLFTVLIFIGV
jgi:hypothetical protein